MNELGSGLSPVVEATGPPPTVGQLRERRARRNSRRIATATVSAVGLVLVVALAVGSGSRRSTVRTADHGGHPTAMPTLPHHAERNRGITKAPRPGSTTSTTTSRTAKHGVVVTVPEVTVGGSDAPAGPSTTVPAERTVPGAPTIGTATLGPTIIGTGVLGTGGTGPSGGKDSAMVTWSAPASDGGSPITSYYVQVTYPVSGTWNGLGCRTGANATSCLVTGIVADDPVTFQVVAINAVGTGPSSAPSNALTAPETAPSAPRVDDPNQPGVVTATAGDGQATMTWMSPINDGGSPITGFVVRSFRSDGSAGPTCSAAADATSCVVTGLTNGTTYTLRVYALNAIGTGDPSMRSNPVTPTATAP